MLFSLSIWKFSDSQYFLLTIDGWNLIVTLSKELKKFNIVPAGSKIIITAGVPFGKVGSTNLMRIATIIKDKDLT